MYFIFVLRYVCLSAGHTPPPYVRVCRPYKNGTPVARGERIRPEGEMREVPDANETEVG